MLRDAYCVLRGAWCGFLVCSLLILIAIPLQAQEPHRAGLVVQFGDGTVVTRCITFSEGEISGEELLRRSGLTVLFDYTSGLGARVCKIESEGCEVPAEDCWCRCQGVPCQYWAYFYISSGGWRYSGLGGSNRTVHDGDIEGWVWGNGRTTPPLFSLDDICGMEATPRTPTVTISSVPTGPKPGAMVTSTVVQPSPTSLASNPPAGSGVTTARTSSDPISYAVFAVVIFVLGGLGLCLYKRMT
ncbi:MAG: hypothetical protein NUW24_11070 [Anaerolineae bacterium]|jgi:hypothetical protein|nr:hypothetical protein [Anaerolineae bacterium]MDH7475071.1 hypothetical protein [Anaerolineae bacterium]